MTAGRIVVHPVMSTLVRMAAAAAGAVLAVAASVWFQPYLGVTPYAPLYLVTFVAADIPKFSPEVYLPPKSREADLINIISGYFDSEMGGFGNGHKFPSHSTLLYLLYFLSIEENVVVKEICTKTLDAMRLRGLNDHLQGGIFRYCVDPEWTIPHFEKMLYDQAMSLWIYSLAFRLTGNPSYLRIPKIFYSVLRILLKRMEYIFQLMMRIPDIKKEQLICGVIRETAGGSVFLFLRSQAA